MLTAEERAQRRPYLGSSDAAAILGLSPFATARDVWWDKCGPEIPDDELKEQQFGSLLEDAVCAYASKRLGLPITRKVFVVADRGPGAGVLAASLDAVVDGRPEGVEAKTAGSSAGWGDEGSDEVPEHVLIQCQHQAYVANLERVWVPALVVGYRAEFRLYCVNRHEGLINAIVDAEMRFYREHIEPRIPPDGYTVPPIEYVKHARRTAAKTVELDADAIAAWNGLEEAKAEAKRIENLCDDRKAAVLALLGDAEAGKLPDGRTITYFEQNSAPRCDYTRLRALHPGAYLECVSQGTHRTLRIQKAKGGK
jgi:putative phage-type endonuclease